MSNVTATPGQFSWTGGDVVIEPVRLDVSPAMISWSGGFVLMGPGTGTSLSVTSPTLNRIYRQMDKAEGETEQQFQRRQQIWQTTMEAIEAAFAALTAQVNDNSILLAEIAAAQQLASVANDNATSITQVVDITSSYVSPSGLLSASNDGTITIAAHTRLYTAGASVSVDAGSIGGYSSGDYVTVFYKDAAREGGAVTYQGSTSPVAQKNDTHVVGQVLIPEAGEPPASGSGTSGPGYIPPPLGTGGEYDEP